jgi:hypothetical protein
MRRLAIAAGILAVTLLPAVSSTAAETSAAETPALTIHAQFVAAESATHYTAIVTGAPLGEVPVVVFWKLTPMQIDPNGQVDATCTKTAQGPVSSEFIWHHGDHEGCDHKKEGTRGHQGRISIKVELRDWDCETTYDGSTGVPPDGPTELCTPLVAATTDPCDEERAHLAQVEAELAAAQESLELLGADYWKAYRKTNKAMNAYYQAQAKHKAGQEVWIDLWNAWDAWGKSSADEDRIWKAYDAVQARIRMLKRERIRARAALDACEKTPKRVAAHVPAARCSAALLTAAKARGAAAGFVHAARRFRGAKFAEVAASLRQAARGLRAAAPRLGSKDRNRVLADARRAATSASGFGRGAPGLVALQRRSAAAAKVSVGAAAALARCRSGGGG